MATLAEITFSIRNQLQGQVVTDDHRLRIPFIHHHIRNVRSLLLDEEISAGIGLDPAFLQIIDCLEVKCDRVVCNGRALPFATKYVDMPSISSKVGNPTYLGLVDGSLAFERLSYTAWLNFTGGSFAFRRPAYALVDGMAILKYIPPNTKWLRLVGALDDPINGGCMLLGENDTYPIPQRLVHKLELLVIKQLMSTLPIAGDPVNDAADPQTVGAPQPKKR